MQHHGVSAVFDAEDRSLLAHGARVEATIGQPSHDRRRGRPLLSPRGSLNGRPESQLWTSQLDACVRP